MSTLLAGLFIGLIIGIAGTVVLYRSRLSDAERANRERLEDLKDSHRREIESLTTHFKTVAGDALEANSRQLDRRNRDSLEAILSPMRDTIGRFTQDFRRMYVDDTNRQTALRESIETLRQLNIQVADETRQLSRALKGNTAMQGQWGEMVLANILENSGLEPGRWLVYQEETRDGDQRLRPDAVIHCPRGRDIIIDAKVSLTAYLRSLENDGDNDMRKAALADHVKSVEHHVKTLQTRRYNERIGKHDPGFVLMFMPHEGADWAALNADPDLWQRANSRGVIIASPTHLITVVRLIEQMWVTEDQTANSIAIAEEATKMLDQFNEFISDLKNIKTSLDRADASWQSALKRLSTGNGNLLRRTRNLRDMGIKTKRAMAELPEINFEADDEKSEKKVDETFGHIE